MQRKLLYLKYTYYESNMFRMRVVYICMFTASFSTATKIFPSEDTDFPCYTLQRINTRYPHICQSHKNIYPQSILHEQT